MINTAMGLFLFLMVRAPASQTLVLDGNRQALEKGGIVGSSLVIVRDGRVVTR